jgi:uncharacterized alpha-E superfamily protein
MPGGFVRIAGGSDAHAVSLQEGGRSADVWVLSEGPVAPTTLLPRPDTIAIRRGTGALPSRAANNLFWLARYVERAEGTLRLIRALLSRSAELDEAAAPVIGHIAALLTVWNAAPSELPARPSLIAGAAMQRGDLDGALPYQVHAARAAASVIRDRFSPDAWRALTDLGAVIDAALPAGPSEAVIIERVNAALRIIASFSGLAQENMSRLAGWRFLELGRRIERAILTCRFVRQFAENPPLDGALDVLLELADSQITYRSRYVMVAARAPVVDLVVLDPNNPRSVAFQVGRIERELAELNRRHADNRLSAPQQIALPLATALRTADPAALDDELILGAEDVLMRLSEAIATSYFVHREDPEPQWEALG